MKKRYIVLSSLLALVVVYILYRSFFIRQRVYVSKVMRGNLVTVVYATGNVSADSTATLRSEAGGIVTFVGVHEGTYVKRGEVLLRTDDRDDLLRVDKARADLEAARIDLRDKDQNLQRIEALYKSGSVTQKSLEDAQTDADLASVTLQQRKIALDMDQEQLTKTRVIAPFSGIIISAKAKLGDYLLANGICFQLIAPSSMLVDAEVDEQDFASVRLGQKSVVAFDAYGDRKFYGYVYRIVPRTDEATKTSKVFVKLVDAPANLNVGMTATVNIVSSELHDIILVPRTAVMQYADSAVVYAVDRGKVSEIKVSLGATDGRLSEILGDKLTPGTRIVSEPGPHIRNGMYVETVD